MRKGISIGLAMVLVMALVGAAIAEEFAVETVPLNVLGRPCAVIKAVRKGGPLSGFLGNTQVAQTTVTVDTQGNLVTLSSSAQQNTGLGDKMVTGTFQNLGLGGMYALGQAIRKPDTTNVNVGQQQGQLQGQGQIQGQLQLQGQQQGQVGINSGFTPPGHDK